MQENFIGVYDNNSDDIAVVVLKTKVAFSRMVAPICIDWNKKYTFQNGSIRKVCMLIELQLFYNCYDCYDILFL